MTIFQQLKKRIKDNCPNIDIREDEPLSQHTSFHIGGKAALLAFPSSRKELRAVLNIAREAGIEPYVMGKGTNLLVSDGPVDKFIVKTWSGVGNLTLAGDDTIICDSGVSLAKLATFAMENGLTGLEFAHGIPGSLGGAVYMNAGAYGGQMSDVVCRTQFIDSDTYQIREIEGDQHGFGYRNSYFEGSGHIILGATLKLEKGDKSEIKSRMTQLASKRKASQPLEYPSAGSTFKRPKTGYAAALIDEAGLKGYTVGGAQVSQKHAGFVINTGGATFCDVMKVIDHVKETVFKTSGVELEPEVKILR